MDGVSTDSSLLHLGHYVLQQVPIPVTSIANLYIHVHKDTHTGACTNAELLCNYGKSTLLILIIKALQSLHDSGCRMDEIQNYIEWPRKNH